MEKVDKQKVINCINNSTGLFNDISSQDRLLKLINALPTYIDGGLKKKFLDELESVLNDVTNPLIEFGTAYDKLRDFKHKYFPTQ